MGTSRNHKVSLIAVWVVLCTVLNSAGWILSALGALDKIGYSVFLTVTLLLSGIAWKMAGLRLTSGFRVRRFRRLFPAAFMGVALLAILGGLIHAPANYDALAYRTPRVLHWLAEGHWHWIHTDFHRLNTRGSGIEWLTAPLLLFFDSDRSFFLINAASFLLLPGLTYSILFRLGVPKKTAAIWMWILPSGYCFLLQAGSIGNDLFGATLAMAALHFALRASQLKDVPSAWIAILAGGLMTAGKGFNLLLLLPWGLAILPVAPLLFKKFFPTAAVSLIALLVSLAPNALLNHKYCGDWKGLKAEPINMATGEPALHLAVNSALILLHNFNPTFNPLAGTWNRKMETAIPADLATKLAAHFETNGAKFKLGEIHMEESSGVGFGVSILLATVLIGRHRFRKPVVTMAGLFSPGLIVPTSALLVAIYFFTQSGLGCPARYLAPFYVMLVAPLLCLPRAQFLLQCRWWRWLALGTFALAALLVIATPPRPLWPAQTVLKALKADVSSSRIMERVWTVYSVYGARSDGFAPVRAALPAGVTTLGFVTFDDPETSLWKPFGSRRIAHLTLADNAESTRKRGIEYALVSEYLLQETQATKMQEWLDRFDAEIVKSFDLSLRASVGSTPWHLVRIRPNTLTSSP